MGFKRRAGRARPTDRTAVAAMRLQAAFLPCLAFASLLTFANVVFAGDREDSVVAISDGDHETAVVRFRQAAEQGDARAQRSLASITQVCQKPST